MLADADVDGVDEMASGRLRSGISANSVVEAVVRRPVVDRREARGLLRAFVGWGGLFQLRWDEKHRERRWVR